MVCVRDHAQPAQASSIYVISTTGSGGGIGIRGIVSFGRCGRSSSVHLHGGSRLDGLRVWGPDADPGGLAPGPVAGLGAPRPFSEGAQSFGESDLAAALSAGDAALDFAAGDHRWSGDQRD